MLRSESFVPFTIIGGVLRLVSLEFRAGRSLAALRDLFDSCALSAGIDRKRNRRAFRVAGRRSIVGGSSCLPTLNGDATPEHMDSRL
jgi:hypothetical protein